MGLILATVFVYAGALKAMAPVQVLTDIQNFDLIPWHFPTVLLAFYLPWLEITCGLAILVKPLRAGALLILTSMLLVFIAALGLAWARGLNISCGCFGGATDHPKYLLWIGRDAGLLVVALLLTMGEWMEA